MKSKGKRKAPAGGGTGKPKPKRKKVARVKKEKVTPEMFFGGSNEGNDAFGSQFVCMLV